MRDNKTNPYFNSTTYERSSIAYLKGGDMNGYITNICKQLLFSKTGSREIAEYEYEDLMNAAQKWAKEYNTDVYNILSEMYVYDCSMYSAIERLGLN